MKICQALSNIKNMIFNEENLPTDVVNLMLWLGGGGAILVE
jgi:hypothetical protein